jgi:hypothetical protein
LDWASVVTYSLADVACAAVEDGLGFHPFDVAFLTAGRG